MAKGRKYVRASVRFADKLGMLTDETEDVAQGLRCVRTALGHDDAECDDYIRGQVNVLLATAEDASTKASSLTEEVERYLAILRQERQEATARKQNKNA
ncbi:MULTISPECIES: hypothetical protein [Gordonibacter]|uniref:Cell division protein ZapA n=1 Tax=Gordonibacter faecis TaxID=3047475 RepID=A0ABT7DSE4_9ACTN|nr:hypothetical protein [Gordonibacter sp. KGMB12511]MDJ1651451.1 hypothetical protein [Gordonibacter sp. KGMB12511]HIW76043.1 hypothetical protein [Candidatus Gordonibacter avicola]